MQAQTSHLPIIRSWHVAGAAVVAGLIVAIVAAIGGPAAGLALAGLVVGALMLAYAPGILFGLYLLIPFYKGALQIYMPIDLTILLAVANALQIVPYFIDGHSRHISRAGAALWFALLVLIMAGVLYAPDQGRALGRLASWVLLICLPISAAALRVGSRPAFVRQLLWTFLGMGVIEVVLGLSLMSTAQRLEVLGANTIAVARAALLVPLIAGLFALRSRFTLLRVAILVLIPASFVVAVASGSRGPILMLAILVVIGAIGFVLRRRTIAWRPTRGVLTLALASIAVFALTVSQVPSASLQRYVMLADFVEAGGVTGVDDSSLTRVVLADAAGQLFEANPFLGVGTAGYAELGPKTVGNGNADAYPHNALLQVAAEYGLVGIGIFVGLVVLALFRPRLARASEALKLVMLFFLFNAMISGDVFDDRMLWGLLMLILLVGARPASTGAGELPVTAGSPDTRGVRSAPNDSLGGSRPDPTPSTI
jgi:O-antigen ligase